MLRTVILPPRALSLPPARELWNAREVLYQFGKRDILLRYRQTAVGVAWVLIQPLASAGIFAIVFGQVANLPSGNVPYFIFTLAGMLAWNLFNGIIGRGAGSLVSNQALVAKVYFPRMLVPLSTIISVMLDFFVGFALFVVLLFVFGVNPGWAILLIPVWVVVTILMASGIAIAASALTVKYRDVTYMLPWILQILLYATPIAYSLEAVDAHLLWIFNINPLTWLMEAFRWSLLGEGLPPAWQLIALPVVSLLTFAGGIIVFQAMERGFADVI
ncbi:ABC transporter permease [Microbacterium ulmi]|uniref:Transport permease protein n=1 Tax=Microbacterium ulmi TaxID=179095 RepID=A0A7Y2Q138_9MICO|nr:ABC transporter permease [Microbacterium ulmi]NII69758.1 lipopolysaccharide transport system permease protein [Microbacterium ulmi]NNH03268.1 ABC transporter permease [Microbacterium ulmi]